VQPPESDPASPPPESRLPDHGTGTRIGLKGWLDPEHPAVIRNDGLPEFRLTLTEVPSPAWRRTFIEQHLEAQAQVGIEHDVLSLSCELGAISIAVDRIRQRIERTNTAVARKEREVEERIARQSRDREAQRLKILAAVASIHFGDS
jgi:hypothetical protein